MLAAPYGLQPTSISGCAHTRAASVPSLMSMLGLRRGGSAGAAAAGRHQHRHVRPAPPPAAISACLTLPAKSCSSLLGQSEHCIVSSAPPKMLGVLEMSSLSRVQIFKHCRYYTPAILELAGIRDKRRALLVALAPAAVNAAGTAAGMLWIDRCGRRHGWQGFPVAKN